MKNDSGLSLVVSIIIIALAAIGGTATYYFTSSNSESKEVKTTDIVLKETLNKKGVISGNSEITLTHVNNRFSRAELLDKNIGVVSDVFMVLIKDEWKIVDITTEPVSCEKMEKIGFPGNMLTDCLLDFPQAKTVADLLGIDSSKLSSAAKFNETFNTTGNYSDLSGIELTDLGTIFSEELNQAIEDAIETEIIGTITIGDDPSCNCFQVTSGGETIEIVYDPTETDPNTFTNIQNGDTVVINTDVSTDDEGEIIFNANNVTEVSPEVEINDDGDPVIEEPAVTNNSNSNSINSDNTNNTSFESNSDNSFDNYNDYDITVFPEPGNVAIPDDQYQNLLDIDNSGIEVEIISDF